MEKEREEDVAVLLSPLWGYGERREGRRREHKEMEAMNAAATARQQPHKKKSSHMGWDRCYYDWKIHIPLGICVAPPPAASQQPALHWRPPAKNDLAVKNKLISRLVSYRPLDHHRLYCDVPALSLPHLPPRLQLTSSSTTSNPSQVRRPDRAY